jgi:hypothetical protein
MGAPSGKPVVQLDAMGPGSVARLPHRLALSCAAACVLAGCTTQHTADQVNKRLDFGMSTAERATANKVAFRMVRKEDASVSARATASGGATQHPGKPGDSSCSSGRVLHITLVGTFPHLPPSAGQVTGQALTVQAATGRVCEAHYLTQPVVMDLESVPLFSTR